MLSLCNNLQRASTAAYERRWILGWHNRLHVKKVEDSLLLFDNRGSMYNK